MAQLCKMLIIFIEIINLVMILHRVAKKAEKPLDKKLFVWYNTKAVCEKRTAITKRSESKRPLKKIKKIFKKGLTNES